MKDDIEADLRALFSPEDAPCLAGVPAADLYRYASGDGTVAEQEAFRAHLRSCATCQADLDAFSATQMALAASRRRRALRWSHLSVPVGVAAAAAAFLLWLKPPEPPSDARVKGGFSLTVALERGSLRSIAAPGAALLAGDVLGFFTSAPKDGRVLLLFADAVGKVSRISAAVGGTPVSRGPNKPFPDGAVLEAGRGCEWIVAFFDAGTIDESKATLALRAAVGRANADCALPPLDFNGTTATFPMRRDAP